MLTLTLTIGLLGWCWIAATEADAADHSRRYLTAVKLNQGLKGTPMQGTGFLLERVAWKWRISPYFVIGVSGKESSLGHASCRSNRKNIWGLKSCGIGPYTDITGDGRTDWLPRFKTWGHAYTFFARYVRARYPHARTPYDFHGYCECGVQTNWAPKVAWFMRARFGVAANVRYP